MKKTYSMLLALACTCGDMQLRAEVKDVTATYVQNYNFSSGNKTVWNTVTESISGTSQNNNCQEFYNNTNNSSWFGMHQDLTVPNGVYRLTINGFVRAEGKDKQQVAIYATTTDREYLTPIWNRHKFTDYNNGAQPNSMGDASAAFYSTTGHYWLNTVDNIMVTDGKLTIGARNIGQMYADIWAIFGNVKLYQLTGNDLKPLMDMTLKEAQAIADEGNFTGKEQLTAAITTAQDLSGDALTASDIRTLQGAIEGYRRERLADASETNPIDATCLIRNAGFEDGNKNIAGTANGHYNQPIGWTLSNSSWHTNNNAGYAASTLEQSGYNNSVIPTEGDYAYAARLRWSTGAAFTLTQDVSLPAGTYGINAALGHLNGADKPVFSVTKADGSSIVNFTASTATPTDIGENRFTLENEQSITIRISITQSGQTDARMAVDHIRLTCYQPAKVDPLQTCESRLTQLNELLGVFIDSYNRKMQTSVWNTLLQRVSEAEQAKDDVANMTNANIQTCIDNLKAAMQPAQSSIVAYEQLKTVIGNITKFTSSAGIDNLNNAIATAQDVWNKGEVDTTGATEAMRELNTAYTDYMVSIAQTEATNVTAMIANPNFEEGQTNAYMADFQIKNPNGWLTTLEGSGTYSTYRHIRVIPYGMDYDGQAPTAANENNENNTLYLRSNWGSNPVLQVSQTVPLPEGRYRLSVDINHYSGNSTGEYTYMQLNGNEKVSLWPFGTGTWETVTREFSVTEGQSLTLSFGFDGAAGGNNAIKLMADNVRLEILGLDCVLDCRDLLEKAKSLRTNTDDTFGGVQTTLDNAINAGESADTKAGYENAVAALKNAIAWGEATAAIDLTTGNATGIIKNPTADEGTNGWTMNRTWVGSGEAYDGNSTTAYFDGNEWSANTHINSYMEQTLLLPKGYYTLSGKGRSQENVTVTMSAHGQSVSFPAVNNEGGNIWEYAQEGTPESTANSNKGRGWSQRSLGFYVENDTECQIKVTATGDGDYLWYSIDDFTLTYCPEKGNVTNENNRVSADKAIDAATLAADITADTRSVDLRDVKVLLGELAMPENMNPNCIIYAPLGLLSQTANVVCNGICTDLSITDKKPFNAPEGFLAKTASYPRKAYTDGYYETLVLPFNAPLPENYSVEEVCEESAGYVHSAPTEDTELQAGKAYMMRYTGEAADGTQDIEFNAENVNIAAFTAPVAKGLFGSTDIFTVTEDTPVYMLSATDYTFKRASNGSTSAPFRACFVSGYDIPAGVNLNIFNDLTEIQDVKVTPEAKADIYDLSGRLVKTQADLREAMRTLRPGIYIINHQKVHIK